jgi:hypothetical protein
MHVFSVEVEWLLLKKNRVLVLVIEEFRLFVQVGNTSPVLTIFNPGMEFRRKLLGSR